VSRTRLAELRQDRVATGYLELAWCLDVERLDHTVVDQHREPLAPHAHATCGEIELEAKRLGVVGAAVGEHPHLVARVLIAAPRTHDERVVDGHARDRVDAFRLQLVVRREVTRHVFRRARRRERARQAEQHDFLAARQFFDRDGIRADGTPILFDVVELLQRAGRKPVTDLDRHTHSWRLKGDAVRLDDIERSPSASQPRPLISTLACSSMPCGVGFTPSRRGIRIPAIDYFGRP